MKTALLVGFSLASIIMISDPVYANGGSNRSCSVHHYGFITKVVCQKAGSRDLPDTFKTESEGNFPSICDGQVGYWTQIPMPGGKTFCVLHLTEFFKGGSWTDGGTTPTCTTTKSKYFFWWKVGGHSYTKDGTCMTKTMDGGPR